MSATFATEEFSFPTTSTTTTLGPRTLPAEVTGTLSMVQSRTVFVPASAPTGTGSSASNGSVVKGLKMSLVGVLMILIAMI